MEEVLRVYLSSDGLSFGEGNISKIQQGKLDFKIYSSDYDLIHPLAIVFNDYENATGGTCYYLNPYNGNIESTDMYEE